MPHFVIEYSRDVEESHHISELVERAYKCGAASGVMQPEDIKVRARPYDHYRLLEQGDSFVHVTVFLLEGRSDDQKQLVSKALVASLADYLPAVTSISADIRDMNATAYKKRLLPPKSGNNKQ
jgi:5-carboxymethyl-2-hydroxymuconate isomerase